MLLMFVESTKTEKFSKNDRGILHIKLNFLKDFMNNNININLLLLLI